MEKTRTQNTILNIAVGFVAQIVIMVLAFINRKVFVSFLSADYLGINGLYSSILSVLALAELGIGYVVQFFFYKPVAEKNYALISTLNNFFKKVYFCIAAVVLVIGICLIPFLGLLVNSELKQNELILYYIIFLFNSVLTYFSAHKISLLAANQDNRLQKYVSLATSIALQFIHIAILFIWHSYLIYTIASVFSTLANVIAVNLICNKKYPYLKDKTLIDKSLIDKSRIIDSVKSTFIYKIGATIINNTDNILISVIVSTAAVGIYSNYLMISNSVATLITIITTALISAIGNLSAEGDKVKMYSNFNMLLLFYHFIAAFGGISLFFLLNDFIPLWVGEEYLLDKATVFAISFNFYLSNAISPIYMFRESNGLFSKVKYLLLSTAVVNIILSVILGEFFGISGILFATALSRILTQVWYEPTVVFKTLFDRSSLSYWKQQGKYVLLSLISAAFCALMTFVLPHSLPFIIIKGILFLIITSLIFSIFSIKTDGFKRFAAIFKKAFKSFKRA